MRILFTILSFLLILYPLGTQSPLCTEENEEIQESQEKDYIFYRYLDCVEGTRHSGKNTILVLYSDVNTIAFGDLQSLAYSMGESVLSKYANFLVLSPQGISLLIYPPVPEPMLKEIATLQQYFPEVASLEGTFLVTLSVSQDTVDLVDILPIDL